MSLNKAQFDQAKYLLDDGLNHIADGSEHEGEYVGRVVEEFRKLGCYGCDNFIKKTSVCELCEESPPPHIQREGCSEWLPEVPF